MRWEEIDKQKIVAFLKECCPRAILVEGFNDCIIGVSLTAPNYTNVVYSKRRIINKLMSNDNMDYFDALEYFDFNIEGAVFSKDVMPIYFDDIPHPSLN